MAAKPAFQNQLGPDARLFRAPGRANLIGEHTDYNDGFVMPAAITLYTWVSAAARNDYILVIRSENFDEQVEVDLNHLPEKGSGRWSDYVAGVAKVLREAGIRTRGANLLLYG